MNYTRYFWCGSRGSYICYTFNMMKIQNVTLNDTNRYYTNRKNNLERGHDRGFSLK